LRIKIAAEDSGAHRRVDDHLAPKRGDSAMTHYKLYFLDDHGYVRSALDLQCEDDIQAIATAEAQRNAGAMELRQSGRCVRSFLGARRDLFARQCTAP
jgi:hypothetical protein